jgi:zinc/manganese transport system ATP-binding protein
VTHGINPLLGAIDRVCWLANGSAAIGSVDEVIRSDVLSRLYGAPIEVVQAGGRVFVATDDEDAHV